MKSYTLKAKLEVLGMKIFLDRLKVKVKIKYNKFYVFIIEKGSKVNMDTDLRKAQLVILEILKEVDRICKNNDIKYFLEGGNLLGAVRHSGFIPWDDDMDIGIMRDDYNKFCEIAPKELSSKFIFEDCRKGNDLATNWIKIKIKNNYMKEKDKQGGLSELFLDVFPYDYYSNNKFIFNNIERVSKARKTEKVSMDKIRFIFQRTICKALKMINRNIYNSFMEFIIKKTNKDTGKVGVGKEVLHWEYYYSKNDLFPLKELEYENILVPVPNNYKKVLTIVFGETYMELPPENKRWNHNLGFLFENENLKSRQASLSETPPGTPSKGVKDNGSKSFCYYYIAGGTPAW